MVAKVNVAVGDRVNASEKLLSFYSLEKLEVRAKLPINLVHEIQHSLLKGEKLNGIIEIDQIQHKVILERLSGEGQASGIDAIFSISDRIPLRIGSNIVLTLQRETQKQLIKVPYQAMYGSDRLYKIVDERLQSVKVKTIGEYQNNTESQLLIKSEQLQSGDIILSTHLPNAFSGLKVQSVKVDMAQ